MGNNSSKTTLNPKSSPTLLCDPRRTEFGKPAEVKQPNGESTLTFWECTTCGRRYEDSAAVGPFITPPPTTECIVMQTKELSTHPKGGFVNIFISGGATCDYVRVKYVIDETDLSEQITEPEDPISPTKVPFEETVLVHAYDTASVQVEERHSRVGRSSRTPEAAWDERDPEGCGFWNAQCNDVDCIFEGNHCRDQCAMAELEEEPQHRASTHQASTHQAFTPQAPTPKVSASNRGLRFRQSAPKLSEASELMKKGRR